MQVAMDPVPGYVAGVAQRLQHRTDPTFVQPVQTFQPFLRQLQVGHRLLSHSSGCNHRWLEVGESGVKVRRDGPHPTPAADHILERQLSVEPGFDIVDVPIPSIRRVG